MAVSGCDCANCLGQRKVTDTVDSGFKGFQCKPRASGFKLGYCEQQGDKSTWVVQSAAKLTYERFCYFTCKPVIPKLITPDVSCTQLSPQEALLGQSPSGNGRAFIWHSNPLTDSVTLSQLKFNKVEVPSVLEVIAKAFGQVKQAEAEKKAEEAANASPTAEAAPAGSCQCKCPAPVTTTVAVPYNPFHTPPPLPARPPEPPGVPPPPPPPPVPPPPLPGPPPLPLLPMVLPQPMQGGPTPDPPPPPTLQPTPPPPPTTTFDYQTYYANYEAATTTEPVPYFDHPFPHRFPGEAPKDPIGPFAPTYPPGYNMFRALFGTTRSPYGAYGTTPSPYGAYGTTRPYFMMLDMSQGDATALPPAFGDATLPPSAEAASFIGMPMPSPITLYPNMAFPPMATPGMPPMAFFQEMSATFRSDRPISGCDCECSNHDKHREALLRAQENAMELMANPEDTETPRDWQ